jgi:hypothetical protein
LLRRRAADVGVGDPVLDEGSGGFHAFIIGEIC